jgi:DNA-binding HxlR family transcriptional regulator
MLVLRDLSWGRQKFSVLQTSLRGISANLLSDRLKKLEESGMVEQVAYSAHPPRFEYRLTAKGKAFVPVLVAMREYGEQWELQAAESSSGAELPGTSFRAD